MPGIWLENARHRRMDNRTFTPLLSSRSRHLPQGRIGRVSLRCTVVLRRPGSRRNSFEVTYHLIPICSTAWSQSSQAASLLKEGVKICHSRSRSFKGPKSSKLSQLSSSKWWKSEEAESLSPLVKKSWMVTVSESLRGGSRDGSKKDIKKCLESWSR